MTQLKNLTEQFGGGGWVQRDALWAWLKAKQITEGEALHRDNATDGRYHHRWYHNSGSSFELIANWYCAETFAPLIQWALNQNPSP